MGNLPGKIILLADACHSAAVAGRQQRRELVGQTELAKEFADAATGAIVFTSSQGQEYSEESSAWQHGAFSKALLDGLAGGADLMKDGSVHLSELEAYVKRRVPDLTDRRQHPITVTPQRAFADFAVARVKWASSEGQGIHRVYPEVLWRGRSGSQRSWPDRQRSSRIGKRPCETLNPSCSRACSCWHR